jgi:putative membrane protein
MFAAIFTLFAQDETIDYALLANRTFFPAFNAILFAVIGIVLAIFGFKLFDWMTPGKLDEEILQKQNMAAAIMAGAFIVGVCIIVAAAIHG